jgi:hypothetical protein
MDPELGDVFGGDLLIEDVDEAIRARQDAAYAPPAVLLERRRPAHACDGTRGPGFCTPDVVRAAAMGAECHFRLVDHYQGGLVP